MAKTLKRKFLSSRLGLVGIGAAGTLLVLPVLALLLAWSGLYNVAASKEHWALTRALLELALSSSVRTHSIGIDAPSLDDENLIRLGAGHYAGGCALCHGAPGVSVKPIPQSMLPSPPPLAGAVPDWTPEQLFWIVKHGFKYTGMPAWVSQHRGDEVWAVVAFLLRLPQMSPSQYRALTTVDAAAGERQEDPANAIGLCARCHGSVNGQTASNVIPRLSGQSAGYLARALRAYASGQRFSGFMEPVAANLSDEEVDQLARYYADLTPTPQSSFADANPAKLEVGRLIAERGLPVENIPACLSCHASGAADLFPRLNGQHAPYIVSQLRILQRGGRGTTPAIQIMEVIAKRLSEEQIVAVAAYFESLDPSESPTAGRNPVQAQ